MVLPSGGGGGAWEAGLHPRVWLGWLLPGPARPGSRHWANGLCAWACGFTWACARWRHKLGGGVGLGCGKQEHRLGLAGGREGREGEWVASPREEEVG